MSKLNTRDSFEAYLKSKGIDAGPNQARYRIVAESDGRRDCLNLYDYKSLDGEPVVSITNDVFTDQVKKHIDECLTKE